MAQKAVDTDTLTCSICLELLKEPVTLPCGHSLCSLCVQSHWDTEESKSEYSCPECRRIFSPRPALVRNIKMAALVEQMKELAPFVSDDVAAPGEVPCDVCCELKLKAVHSCLQCLVSYCERHVQPHRDVAMLQRHQLVSPCENLQEYLCSEHNEVKKMFCRTDQQLLCVVCCLNQHKDHDTVLSAVERAEREAQLENRKLQELKSISDREADLKRLQEEAQAINHSAQEAVQLSGQNFTQLFLLVQKKRSVVEQQIRAQEKTELRRLQELQDQVQQDITQRKKTISQMDVLLKTSDHNRFIQDLLSFPKHVQAPSISTVPSKKVCYFGSVTKAVSELEKKVQQILNESNEELSMALREVHTLLPFREAFLKYSCDITLDPNTAHQRLRLSEGNRRVTKTDYNQNYPDHPDRSEGCYTQVLSSEALTGYCYWEVEKLGCQWGRLALTYRDIVEYSVGLGNDDESWALQWSGNSYSFVCDQVKSQVSGSPSSRLGVFLDHSAGILSFYNVTDQTLTRLHTVRTTFSEPLHVGVWISNHGSTVFFPQIK